MDSTGLSVNFSANAWIAGSSDFKSIDTTAATLSGAILFFFKVFLTSEISSSGSVPRSQPTPTAMVLGW